MNNKSKYKNLEKTIKVGDIVTVLDTVDCRYSGYSGRRKQVFTPENKAEVVHIKVPKVRKRGGSDYFINANPIDISWPELVSINYENLVKVS